jgi:hypothetical protein
VIPTMIVVGLVLGRWWRWTIPAAAVAWAVLLLAMDVIDGASFLAAIAFGAANAAVGAALFLLGRTAARWLAHMPALVRSKRQG